MIVQIQILSKVITSNDYSIIENNLLTEDYFDGFKDEYNFIKNHLDTYGNVPDKVTFLAKFPTFEFTEVAETDKYLVDTIREEKLFSTLVPVIQKAAQVCESDSNEAVKYLLGAVKELQPNYNLGGVDIISQATQRFDEYLQRKEHQDTSFFTCGFEELDDITHGIQRGEELYVIFARTNQGKSWIVEKMCTHVWQLGFNVGYISPEMTSNSIGFRFDTLVKNFSNKALMWGKGEINDEEYKQHIEELKTKTNKFLVATPTDFNKKITVTKVKNWVEQYKLDMVAIDGITYMTDERYRRGDNKTTSLTNISEDLMNLSVEMGIPILIVVQANREGLKDNDGAPELENIRDSDGISHNASKVLSIKQIKDSNVVELCIKKQRFGPVNQSVKYQWNIDKGEFIYIPTYDDAKPVQQKQEQIAQMRKSFNDSSDVF
jgi:replicative DNA helicase